MTRLAGRPGRLLRDRVPMRYRSKLARTRVAIRRPTAAWRLLPSFIVIGAQRAGTSSLYRYLSAHPGVRRPLRKEVDFFSVDHGRGTAWYRSHFPLRIPACVTFEATPQYFVHPLAPARVRELLPDIKLIIAVRDPVDRALSHYRLMRQIGVERLDLARAIDSERDRVRPDLDRLRADPAHRATDFLRFSYVMRSRYGEQLARWREHFPAASFHILDFDAFRTDPTVEWTALLDFVGLEQWCPPDFTNWSTQTNAGGAEDSAIRSRIAAALGDDPCRFSELSGRSFDWAQPPAG